MRVEYFKSTFKFDTTVRCGEIYSTYVLCSQNEINNHHLSIQATRAYLVTLATSGIIVGFYSSISVYTRSVAVLKPSLTTFENLQSLYPFTLTCRCTQVAILHYQMITVKSPRYHQVRVFYSSPSHSVKPHSYFHRYVAVGS